MSKNRGGDKEALSRPLRSSKAIVERGIQEIAEKEKLEPTEAGDTQELRRPRFKRRKRALGFRAHDDEQKAKATSNIEHKTSSHVDDEGVQTSYTTSSRDQVEDFERYKGAELAEILGRLKEADLLEVAELIIERASPDDRALIAGMALPEHKDIFQAISLAKQEFAARLDYFSKPPLPKLSTKQLNAITGIARARPWRKRGDDARNPFEWVRDHYKEWAGRGLLQAHLKADPKLYEAFAKRVTRLGLPDWLDVPNEGDAFMRRLADPSKQFKALVSRHLQGMLSKVEPS